MLDAGHIVGCSKIPFNVGYSLINILVMSDVGHILGCSTIPVILAKAEKRFLWQ
jgi:predicted metal-dependent RNase